MYQYRISVTVGNANEQSDVHRSKPIEDREIREIVAKLVKEMITDDNADPVGEAEWTVYEITEIKSGTLNY